MGGLAIGITIHYRGKLADISRVEDLEDRVLDLALELGGQAQIWRSTCDDNPRRIVRGLILTCAPGQESTSLLVSPEGWLIGLIDIEDAEKGTLTEPPWCFVKTQFGPVEGHVTLVEILTGLKREFIPDLEVSDESGYWESRDATQLAKQFATLQRAIDGLADGLQRHGLSAEAAEDPNILIERVSRIAEQVRRSLARPSEHARPMVSDDEGEFGESMEADRVEAEWDEMFKHNRRMQERVQRHLEERLARGEDFETAFDGAMDDAGIGTPDDLADDEDAEDDDETASWQDDEDLDSDDEDATEDWTADDAEDEDNEPFERPKQHPLLERATQFWHRLHELFHDETGPRNNAQESIFHGVGDLVGGLAQAMRNPHEDEEDVFDDRGLRIVQLKRALRNAAFTRGGLFQVRATGVIPGDVCDSLRETLREIENEVFAELSRIRESLR